MNCRNLKLYINIYIYIYIYRVIFKVVFKTSRSISSREIEQHNIRMLIASKQKVIATIDMLVYIYILYIYIYITYACSLTSLKTCEFRHYSQRIVDPITAGLTGWDDIGDRLL